ncbi:MAG: response regulator transcription factor [Eubacterium sp.]|nr:response regulator transcription factor [Eubacterium sp.]
MDYSVLVIDDEVELADSTAEYFNMFDVPSLAVYTAEEALAFFEKNTTKLILLDINLKDGSGFELCKKIRKDYDIPILFISARSSEDDMVIALNIGGDDYITKPYSLNVLYAKVKVVLARYEKLQEAGRGQDKGADSEHHDSQSKGIMQNTAASGVEAKQVTFIGGIEIDYDAGLVRKDGRIVELTAMEYRLLIYLMENRGKIVSKQKIFENVWQDSFVSDGTLNVHVRHLREKLEEDPNNPKIIKTLRGMGLMLCEKV